MPKALCRACHPELNTTREQWKETTMRKDPPMAKGVKDIKTKLAELNALRLQRGIDPIKHWRASYEGLVEAIEECKKRIAGNVKASALKEAPPIVAVAQTGRAKRKAATVPEVAKEKIAKASPPPKVAAKPGTVEAFNESLNIRGDSIRGKLTTLLYNNISKEVPAAKLMTAGGINASGLKGALKYIDWRMGEKKVKFKLAQSEKGAKLTKI